MFGTECKAAEELPRFLAEASGARQVRIGEPELLAGGAIRQNWGVEAEFAGGTCAGRHSLVLRTDAATGVASSLDRIEEFAVQRAAFAAGITVAEPFWACTDPKVIGKAFFVMRRVAGTAQGRQITTDSGWSRICRRRGAARRGIGADTDDPAAAPRPRLSTPYRSDPAHRRVPRLSRPASEPRPVLEWAIRWLETHIPEPLPPVLCHRDFRTGNYMLDYPRGPN